MTLLLFLIVIFIYTSFGMYFFGDEFRGGENHEDKRTCANLMECFVQVASHGIRTPDDLSMDPIFSDNAKYVQRVAYDLSFFIIIGALLFNMVTGIIVDTFGELREASKEHAETLANSCFICGVSRAKLEEPGPGGVIFDFNRHQDEEHCIWNYVYYINYLTRKDPLEFNGVESDISAKIAAHDTSWFPIKRWWKLQEQERQLGSGGAGGEMTEEQRELRELRQHAVAQKEALDRLAKSVEDMSAIVRK